MLKHKFKEFKKSTLTEPFYKKAKRTLKKLMSDLAIGSQFSNIERKYFQVSKSEPVDLDLKHSSFSDPH